MPTPLPTAYGGKTEVDARGGASQFFATPFSWPGIADGLRAGG